MGGMLSSGISKLWAGTKTAGKEGARAALYSAVLGGNNSEKQSLSQRVGGAIGESFKSATFDKMGTLGKAISSGSGKSKKKSSPTGGGGVQGETIGYQQVKTDNVITAINQSSRQIVSALNTMNATQRMGFNAQTNQIQSQAEILGDLRDYGQDTVSTLQDIYDLLNKQDYESNAKGGGGGGSTMPAFAGANAPDPANDNNKGGGLIGDAITGDIAGGAMGLAGAAGRKLFGKGGEKAGAKGAEKLLTKGAEKTLLKTALKKIPGIGLLMGVGFAADRLMSGDVLGAGGELLSGALSTIPGFGTAASFAVDAGLAAKDFGAFGEAGSADAAPVGAESVGGNDNNTELTKEESLNVIHAFQKKYGRFGSREEILNFAESMYPGRKFTKLISTINKLESGTGPQSSISSNVQLASNEILPGMLGSGEYLSQRQQQLDTSRQGGDSGIPTLTGSFGPNTSESALRQEEANLENANKNIPPNKIEITTRELTYKADNVTFDVDTLKFLFKKKEEGTEGTSSSSTSAPSSDTSSVASAPSGVTPQLTGIAASTSATGPGGMFGGTDNAKPSTSASGPGGMFGGQNTISMPSPSGSGSSGGSSLTGFMPASSSTAGAAANAKAAAAGAEGQGQVIQEQAKNAGIRKGPLSSRLVSVLKKAADAVGGVVRVQSGGQAAKGTGGPRTGSTRHDNGNAADLDLYVGGQKVSPQNPAGRNIMMQFLSAARKAGATGIGAGEDYMSPDGSRVHVGFGKEAIWGSNMSSSSAPDWLRAAVSGVPAGDAGPDLSGMSVPSGGGGGESQQSSIPNLAGGGATATATQTSESTPTTAGRHTLTKRADLSQREPCTQN